MLISWWEVHWGMGNFMGGSSAFRRRVDQGKGLIFARAAHFAAQMEQTKHDRNRILTTKTECLKGTKKASESEDSKAFLLVAEAGLEPTTSGL